MTTVLCSLFDGDYHHGVAALINSLAESGFNGRIEVGYRCRLPAWAAAFTEIERGSDYLLVAVPSSSIRICWRRYDVAGHFTNLKPQFIKHIWEMNGDAEKVFYFDPDIVLIARWNFFEQWLSNGIALAEDVRPPMPKGHPTRRQWRDIFGACGFQLKYRGAAYANGGFVGVHRDARAFLDVWHTMMEIVSREIGGLDVSGLPGGRRNNAALSINAPFAKSDQDALNAATEAYDGDVTILGPEAMGFVPGGYVMSHAVSTPKPWQKSFVLSALKGYPPTNADKVYWNQPMKPINSFGSKTKTTQKRLSLAAGIVIGRFFSKRY